MRQNKRNIPIHSLEEKKARKKAAKEKNIEEDEIKKFHESQLKRESSGKFVWAKPGCQILVKEGENKDERIAKFLERIEKGNF